jgi:hypothetical protein
MLSYESPSADRQQARRHKGKKVKQFLTPAEVADRYGQTISVRTLANWRSTKNSPPYVKVGGRVLYPVDRLIEWEQRRTMAAPKK